MRTFFIAAIGSSIEIFGKYEKIIDDEGSLIRADILLEEVRKIVISYALKQVLRDGFNEGNITINTILCPMALGLS